MTIQKLPEQVFAVLNAVSFIQAGILPFIGQGHPAEPIVLMLPHFAARCDVGFTLPPLAKSRHNNHSDTPFTVGC